MTECVICFETFNDKLPAVQCENRDCDCKICGSCLGQLINFSYSSENLPACPGQGCESYFSYQTLIENLDSKVFYVYARALFNYFRNLNANEIDFNVRKAMTVDQLRVEKLHFLQNAFPKGILALCRIALPKKLQHVQTLEGKLYKEIKSGEPCPLISCKGFLKSDTKRCVLCNTQFCQSCLKKKQPGHVCKDEDIATMQELNSYIRCPGCTLPVFKDSGCSSVTCSNCKTNFKYAAECPKCDVVTENTENGSFHCVKCNHVFRVAGETLASRGGHGSMNQEIDLEKDTSLYQVYREIIKNLPHGDVIFSELQYLEVKLAPRPPSDQPLKKLLIELELLPEPEREVREKRLLVQLVKTFDKFNQMKEAYSFYIEDLDYLERLIIKKKLTLKKLNIVIRDY